MSFGLRCILSLVSYPIRCSFLALIFLRGPYVYFLLSTLGLILVFFDGFCGVCLSNKLLILVSARAQILLELWQITLKSVS